MSAWTVWLALLLASQPGHTLGEIVEASTVTNVIVVSNVGWDLENCGVGGCDPRLTRDGDDNTVPDSRWSCEPELAATFNAEYGYTASCGISFELGDYDSYESFQVDHIMLYVHESDTQSIAIPFTVEMDYGTVAISDLTTPGLALGSGQRVNVNEETYRFALEFELTNGQYINLSEVEIYLDVEDPTAVVVEPLDELFVVNAKTVSNVVASALSWDLRTDAGCGVEGCVAGLAVDGQDNTAATSRWSCQAYEYDYGCALYLSFASIDPLTISYIVVYVPDSDDATKEGLSFEVSDSSSLYGVPCQITPGVELGEGQRFNMPRPESHQLTITPTNVTAGQVIEISEVEIFVEVTDTSVPIAAAEAWTEVTADSLTTVTALSSESLPGFTADATRDGDDNTVAASRWSCDGTGEAGNCVLYFEFNDEYTVSYLELYMHESANAAKEPVPLEIKTCSSVSFFCDSELNVGTYMTKPGTALGEPERVNLLTPLTSTISIICSNLTAIGGTIDISEVEIYLQVPDATPTPAPFISPAPTLAPTYSWEREDDDDFTSALPPGDDNVVVDSDDDWPMPEGDDASGVDDSPVPDAVGDDPEVDDYAAYIDDDRVLEALGDLDEAASMRLAKGGFFGTLVTAVVAAGSSSMFC